MIERYPFQLMSEKHKCEREKSWTWTLAGICPICYYWRLLSLAGLSMIAVVRNQRYHCWNTKRLWNSYHLYLSLVFLTILFDSMLLEDKQQFKFRVMMTGISTVFLVVLLVVKWPRQAQIRRKTYKSKKKHQDRVQDAKRQEKAQKVKKYSIPSQHDVCHRATMKAPCTPSNQKK